MEIQSCLKNPTKENVENYIQLCKTLLNLYGEDEHYKKDREELSRKLENEIEYHKKFFVVFKPLSQ